MNELDLALLSNSELLEDTAGSVKTERKGTVRVLERFAEIDHRKLYAEAGYSSLYAYVTIEYSYSEPAAHRRISSARAIRKFPELKPLLVSGKLSFSTLARISPLLTQENKAEIIERVAGKSTRDVETLVAEFAPKAAKPKEKIKSIVVKVPPVPVPAEAPKQHSFENHLRQEVQAKVEVVPEKPVVEERLRLNFSIEKSAGALIEEAKILLSNKYPKGANLETLFCEGLLALMQNEHQKRNSLGTKKARGIKEGSRHIPAAV